MELRLVARFSGEVDSTSKVVADVEALSVTGVPVTVVDVVEGSS